MKRIQLTSEEFDVWYDKQVAEAWTKLPDPNRYLYIQYKILLPYQDFELIQPTEDLCTNIKVEYLTFIKSRTMFGSYIWKRDE